MIWGFFAGQESFIKTFCPSKTLIVIIYYYSLLTDRYSFAIFFNIKQVILLSIPLYFSKRKFLFFPRENISNFSHLVGTRSKGIHRNIVIADMLCCLSGRFSRNANHLNHKLWNIKNNPDNIFKYFLLYDFSLMRLYIKK